MVLERPLEVRKLRVIIVVCNFDRCGFCGAGRNVVDVDGGIPVGTSSDELAWIDGCAVKHAAPFVVETDAMQWVRIRRSWSSYMDYQHGTPSPSSNSVLKVTADLPDGVIGVSTVETMRDGARVTTRIRIAPRLQS